MKARAFTFTLNNYTDDDIAYLNQHECVYIVYGKERAPTTGTPHLQGYVYYKNPRSIKAVQKLRKWHVMQSRGSPESNYKYCLKLDDPVPNTEFYERGDRPKQPEAQGETEQDRWLAIWDAAKAGRMEDIPADVRIRHYSAIKRIRVEENNTKPPMLETLDNHWIYGPPGSGKSTYVRNTWPDHYLKPTTQYWNGYNGEDVVRIKEFDRNHAALASDLKQWTEHEPFKGREMYGKESYIRPKTIVVESNYHPRDIFNGTDSAAIERRFNIKHYDYRI